MKQTGQEASIREAMPNPSAKMIVPKRAAQKQLIGAKNIPDKNIINFLIKI